MSHTRTDLIIHTKSGRDLVIRFHGNREPAECWADAFSHWVATKGAFEDAGPPRLDAVMAGTGDRFVVPFESIESLEVR